jgi:hypothetical protein
MKILTIKMEGDIIRLNRSKQVGITYFFRVIGNIIELKEAEMEGDCKLYKQNNENDSIDNSSKNKW